MAISPSRILRLDLEEQFADAFTPALKDACGAFGISNLEYEINFRQADGLNQNFYRKTWTLTELMEFYEPVFPALCMWTNQGGEYGPGVRSTPRTFSGFVFVYWRFFLSFNGLRSEGLTDLREATESALLEVLVPELNSVTYRKDLAWSALDPQVWQDRDGQNVGFIQVVDYQASFEVNA